MSNEQPCRICGASWGEFGCACQSPAGTGDEPGNYRDWSGASPATPLIPTEQPEREDAFNRPNEALIYASKQVVEGLRKAMEPEDSAPPAVTAKPDKPMPSCGFQALLEGYDLGTGKKAVAAPVEQASAEPLHAQLTALAAKAEADRQAETNPHRERIYLGMREAFDQAARLAASIPPQQAPDPIYLIRPKAGGPTWTECISEQSHDAAMRLGVYESRVVVEVGGQEKSS